MADLAALNKQFAIPGNVSIVPGQGNLPAVKIENGTTEGLIYLHGAHVALWRPKGHDEVLWLSEKSAYENNKPIRGGVPICFPWFGPRADAPTNIPSPAHGFVRLTPWSLDSISHHAGEITVTLSTQSSPETKASWNHDFLLKHRITMGRTLTMTLELTNTGKSPLTAQEALHTYFSVEDVKQIKITGLENVDYIDKTDNLAKKKQEGPITISAETDRVYLNTTSTTTIHDPIKRRQISIAKSNSKTTVVWNPWIAKAKAMPDFGDNEWPSMLCIETCNVADFALTLAPGATHAMTATISVDRM